MPQIENPYQDKPSGARPAPGILEQQIAYFLEGWLRIVGINLYQHEHEGLAHVIGAVLRSYPDLANWWVGANKERGGDG